jgi:hypothetical protein
MTGGLQNLFAYEALTGFTFLQTGRILGDAFNYEPPAVGNTGRTPVLIDVALSQIIEENRIAVGTVGSPYIQITIPTPVVATPSGDHLTFLWNYLTQDVITNLIPVFRLPKYLDMIDLVITNDDIQFDFSRMNTAIDTMANTSPYEAAALVLDLSNTYQKNLDQLGWNGTEQLSYWSEQSITNPAIKQAFIDTGFMVFADTDGYGFGVNDLMTGNQNNNYLWGGSGNDIINGLGGDDRLDGDLGDDLINGGAGDDTLNGGNGDDQLNGGTGNDVLNGASGDDVLIGGAGNDTLNGETGNDTYVFNLGDGQDMISDWDWDGTINILKLGAGITTANTQIKTNPNAGGYGLDIELIFNANDRIKIPHYIIDNNINRTVLTEIQFADGTQWTKTDVLQRATENKSTFQGAANDSATLTQNQLTLSGTDLLANDQGDGLSITGVSATSTQGVAVSLNNGVISYASDASAKWQSLGAGQAATDSLSYTIADSFNRTSTATVALTIKGQNDAVVVNQTIAAQSLNAGQALNLSVANAFTDVDQGDVLTWTATAINTAGQAVALPNWLSFDAATQTLTGTAPRQRDAETLNIQLTAQDAAGTTASQQFSVNIASATINGTAGNDTLVGTADIDWINAGTGNDRITTGTGSDELLFNLGDGQDIITDWATNDQFNLNTSLVNLRSTQKINQDLRLNYGKNDAITVTGFYQRTTISHTQSTFC